MLEPLTSLVPAVQQIPKIDERQEQTTLRRQVNEALQKDAAHARIFLKKVMRGRPFANPFSDAAVRTRADAAKALLALAGFVAPKAADAPGSVKDPSEMGSDELRAFLARAERELGNRARLVDSAPSAPEPSQQVIDMLG